MSKKKTAHDLLYTEIKPGHLMAFIDYVMVTSQSVRELNVRSVDTGTTYSVIGYDLIDKMPSAEQYTKIAEVTKTKAAEILVSLYNTPFTVSFTKQSGEERVLRGRLVAPEPLLGRSKVEDLDETKDRLRLVDHREINWIIANKVKYVVKN